MSRNRQIVTLGILLLAALAPIAALGDLSVRTGSLLILWGAAHAFYLGAAWIVTRAAPSAPTHARARAPARAPTHAPAGGGLALVGGVALAARLLVLPSAPSLSEDVYRYLWDGRLVSEGVNPYPHAPDDPALERFHDGLRRHLNHADVPTIYPPAAQLLFGAVARVEPSPLAWKLAMLSLEIPLWIALGSLLRRRGLPPERLLVFAWNPLVIIESYGSGHLDLVLAAFLTLGLALAEARRPLSAGFSFALAALTKYTALFLVPFYLRRREFKLLAAAAAAAVILFLPFAGAGRSLWAGLAAYLAHWEYNGALYGILRAATRSDDSARLILAGALLVATLAISFRARSAVGAAAALWTAYLLLSPTVFPWYLVPLIALLPIVPDAGLLAFSGLVALSYLPLPAYQATGIWSLPAWIPAVEYGGLAAVWAGVALNRARRRGAARARPRT